MAALGAGAPATGGRAGAGASRTLRGAAAGRTVGIRARGENESSARRSTVAAGTQTTYRRPRDRTRAAPYNPAAGGALGRREAAPGAGAPASNGGAGAGASGAPRNLAVGRGVRARADGDAGGSARSGTVTAGAPTVGRRSRERARGARGGATTGRTARAGTCPPGARASAVAGRAQSPEACGRPRPGRRIGGKPPVVAQAPPGGRLAPRGLDRVVHRPSGGLEHAGVLSRTPRSLATSQVSWRLSRRRC